MNTGQSLARLRERPHWSHSQINALANSCSLAWAFRYIYRQVPEFVSASLVFGTAFHAALSYHAARRMQGRDCTAGECSELLAELLEQGCHAEAIPIRFGDGESAAALAEKGRDMIRVLLGSVHPEDEIEGVGVPFSVPLVDASGRQLGKPLIGEYDLVVRGPDGVRTVVDWKTSARRWPEGKAEKDLQATCYLWAERQQGHGQSRFRFEVVTKTKSPVCERHPATREMNDFVRLGELVGVLERMVANECFHPREGGWECNGCPYTTACRSWHRFRYR